MTDREKAIVMAYTGVCMLTGDKFQIFHKYIEDIMGRPIMTLEIGGLENEIKKKSKADFIELCGDESSSENLNKWIPVSERLPEENRAVLTYIDTGATKTYCLAYWNDVREGWEEWIGYDLIERDRGYKVIAWMPLPEPYKAESEDKE